MGPSPVDPSWAVLGELWPCPSPGVDSTKEGCSDSAGCQDGLSRVFPLRAVFCALCACCRGAPQNVVVWPALRNLPEFGLELRFSFSALKTL